MCHFFQFLGVIKVNESDTAKLLYAENINQEKLFEYAREAADFATEYQMPHLDFAVNHYGKPDVAMFDFTSMFQVNKGTNEFHILFTYIIFSDYSRTSEYMDRTPKLPNT